MSAIAREQKLPCVVASTADFHLELTAAERRAILQAAKSSPDFKALYSNPSLTVFRLR